MKTVNEKVLAVYEAYLKAFKTDEEALKHLYECADLVGMGYTAGFDYKSCKRGSTQFEELLQEARK